MNADRIVLIGFSGTGKSSVATLLAEKLGWIVIDIDQEIERFAGKSIPTIFGDDGETRFREFERSLLVQSLSRDRVVIATGGGAAIADDAWTTSLLRSPGTVTITLDAAPSKLLHRLVTQQSVAGETIERPLLATSDPLDRITTLKESRQEAYDRSDLTIVTDEISSEEVAHRILNLIRDSGGPDIELRAASGSSQIFVRPGIVNQIGAYVQSMFPNARQVWIITDANVGALHAQSVSTSLEDAEQITRTITVPPGESSKSWDTAGRVIGKLLSEGIQRNDLIVALGGGVVGDLAGYAAAVTLRGIGIVQVPTSLLAMVDSSVGGKTGINHPAGKNLIGAFYQPPLVLVDPDLLLTLPPRELTQSYAEMVKHAIIQPSTPGRVRNDLFPLMHRNRTALNTVNGLAMTYLIRRNIELKARVVEADERESSHRAILNYGHTIGHAIEAAEYRYLHGEAVAVGMRAANRIAALTNRIDGDRENELNSLISAFGLPTAAQFDPAVVRERMKSDKKKSAGQQTWVLPDAEGGVSLRTGVSDSVVEQALEAVLESVVRH